MKVGAVPEKTCQSRGDQRRGSGRPTWTAGARRIAAEHRGYATRKIRRESIVQRVSIRDRVPARMRAVE
jgi:hypothetical protein